MAHAATTAEPDNGCRIQSCYVVPLPKKNQYKKAKSPEEGIVVQLELSQQIHTEINEGRLITPLSYTLSKITSPVVYLYENPQEEPDCWSHYGQRIKDCRDSVLKYLPDRCSNHPCKQEVDSRFKYLKFYDKPVTTDSSAEYSRSLKRGLFVHVYFIIQQSANGLTKNKKISKIIFFQHNDNDDSKETVWGEINKVMDDYKGKWPNKNLVVIHEGNEITDMALTLRGGSYSLVTIMERPSTRDNWYATHHMKSYETAVQVYIHSIVFNENYSSKIEYFLNYCNQKKASKLGRCELEMALLTLIELIRERFIKFSSNELHITYYDLQIPESIDSTWEYNDFKLILVDTLVEYVRTRHLPDIDNNHTNDVEKGITETFTSFMPEFLSCLQETLDGSLKNDIKKHSSDTVKLICKTMWIYLLSFIFASVLVILYPCSICYDVCKLWRQGSIKTYQWRIFVVKWLTYFCTGLLILPLFNIIQYYWGSIRSFDVNELEIYWPLALIISVIIVLNVCQASMDYRNLSKENKSIQKAFNKAHDDLLEAKSEPYWVVTATQNGTEKILFQKLVIDQQLHPTSLQEPVAPSITQYKTFRDYFGCNCHCLMFICLVIISLIIAGIHSFIPTISRRTMWNETIIVTSEHINVMRISYIVFSLIFYSLLTVMMSASIVNYLRILNILKNLLASTTLIQKIDIIETGFCLNLREPKNLEYFLSLFQAVKRNIDPYHIFLSTMACVVIIDMILIITVVIDVFVYGYSVGLLATWCLIDILILSIYIMVFLGIVVFINKLLTHDFILHLKTLKKTMIQENRNADIVYLNVVIEHMESASREYAVKLLGFVVDHKLALRVIIAVLSSFLSAFVAFLKNR